MVKNGIFQWGIGIFNLPYIFAVSLFKVNYCSRYVGKIYPSHGLRGLKIQPNIYLFFLVVRPHHFPAFFVFQSVK